MIGVALAIVAIWLLLGAVVGFALGTVIRWAETDEGEEESGPTSSASALHNTRR